MGTPWEIGGGQFKDPLDHEQLASDAMQVAADRTFVDDELAGGEAFSRGITLRYADTGAAPRQAAHQRVQRAQRRFSAIPHELDQLRPSPRQIQTAGDWRDYQHFTSEGNHADPLLVIGAGADYTEAGPTDYLASRGRRAIQYRARSGFMPRILDATLAQPGGPARGHL